VPDTHTLTPRLVKVLEAFEAGKRIGLARAISAVENHTQGFQGLLHRALGKGPRAHRVGLTGPPGAGKSSLVAALAERCRGRDQQVGVVAVDPTSPFSGGALLGDRIRMNDLATDPGMFIRSMATRGSLGGLAVTSKEVIDLMDAYGMDRLFVETVGVGQTELEITGAADTVVVVLVPESGDGIQAMKAGLMEIADIFIVNKSDRPGADRLVKELRTAIHLREGEALRDVPAHHGVDLSAVGVTPDSGARARAAQAEDSSSTNEDEAATWTIPILRTVAHAGEGVDELLDWLDRHRAYLGESGQLEARRRKRARVRVREVVERGLRQRAWTDTEIDSTLQAGVEAIAEGRATPYSVADEIMAGLLRD
jgi:GTPase